MMFFAMPIPTWFNPHQQINMPRQTRIEFPGAFYHCSARGAGGHLIVMDDRDRAAHESLVAEVAQRTGWEIYAWALLDDHYHMVLGTPEANLVSGMKWFQNFWTKRFNARHERSGSVFGGRYKSVLVQKDGHLSSLIDHVHLNAFRAGLVTTAQLASHPWSSLKDYLLPPSARRPWVRAGEGLDHMGYDGEDCDERLRYLEHLEDIAVRLGGRAPLPGAGRTLHSTLRRGWYLGEESFRGELIAVRQQGRVSPETRGQAHGAEMAQRILAAGLSAGGLTYEGLDNLRKSDWRKRAIGRAIRLRTTVPTEWIASNLRMGVSSRVALLVARDPEPSWGKSWRPAKELLDRLLEIARHAESLRRPDIPQEGETEKEAICPVHPGGGNRGH
jgi:putative transposase